MINKTFLLVRVLIGLALLSSLWVWLEGLPYYGSGIGSMGRSIDDLFSFGLPGIIILITALFVYSRTIIKAKNYPVKKIRFFILEVLIFVSLVMIIMALESHWIIFSDFLTGNTKHGCPGCW